MSLLTPAVLLVLALAALLALIGRRVRSRKGAAGLLLVASALCVGAFWLGITDGWSFRDGFPFLRRCYQETRGLAAARAFLAASWVPLLASLATGAWIASSWRGFVLRVEPSGAATQSGSRCACR